MKLENKEPQKIDTIVTFTFHDSENLGTYFVESLEEMYGKENVTYIDQSTYGIANDSIDTDSILRVLVNAEKKGEKCKNGDEISIIQVENSKQLTLNRSIILNTRLEGIKKK